MAKTISANPVMTIVATKAVDEEYAAQFGGLSLFPAFHVAERSAAYYVIEREALLSMPERITRAPGDTYVRSPMRLADDSYTTREYGFEEPVDDTERAIYISSLHADQVAVRRATRVVFFNHEMRCAKLAKTIAQGADVAAKWNAADATPIADVKAGKAAIHKATGMEANLLVIPRLVYDALTECETILERIKYVTGDSITEVILARLFGVQKVVVAGGIKNTAPEGQPLDPAYLWGNDCYLAVTSSTPDLRSPSFGRTFVWQGDENRGGAKTEIVRIGTYRDDARNSDIHRAHHWTDEKIIGPELGYRIKNCL